MKKLLTYEQNCLGISPFFREQKYGMTDVYQWLKPIQMKWWVMGKSRTEVWSTSHFPYHE